METIAIKIRPATGQDFKTLKTVLIPGSRETKVVDQFKIGFPYWRKVSGGFLYCITKHTAVEHFVEYAEELKAQIEAGLIYVAAPNWKVEENNDQTTAQTLVA